MKQESIGALTTFVVLLAATGIVASQMTDVCSIDFASSWNNATPVVWSCRDDFVDADACYEGCADWDCTSGVSYNSGDGLFGYGCYEDEYNTCKTPQGQCVLLKKWEREITPYECNGQQYQLSRTILLVNRGCEELVSSITSEVTVAIVSAIAVLLL